MATYTKFNSLVEAICEKVHNFGSDQLTVALTNSAPSASNTKLSDITEISYTNLSSRDLTTLSSSQTSGVYKLVLQSLTLTASGAVGPFRYAVIYNNTAGNDEVVAYYDYGSSITLTNGDSFVITTDGTNGLFQLT